MLLHFLTHALSVAHAHENKIRSGWYEFEFHLVEGIGEEFQSPRIVLPRAANVFGVIKRREGADSPDSALYAVIHAALRQPRETRVLGQLLRSDSDPHDYVVYKGESFRIGRALYRVNWISQEEAAIAAGTYRNPDAVRDPLKLEYD